MIPFVCTYCQRKCRQVTYEKHDSSSTVPHWRCDYHGAVVVKFVPSISFQTDTWHMTILGFQHKETNYQLVFNYGNPNVHEKFRVEKVSYVRGQPNEPIVRLDFHPENITPENAIQKLPTLILFS